MTCNEAGNLTYSGVFLSVDNKPMLFMNFDGLKGSACRQINAALRLIVSPSRGVWGGVYWFGFEILGYPQHFSRAAGLLKEKGF